MYDITVIGNDLSSWIAALIASRSGMETALVLDEPKGFDFTMAGYTFPTYPLPPSGFGDGQIFPALFRELGLNWPEGLELQPVTNGLQVLMPNHWLDLSRDETILERELAREFPRLARHKDFLEVIRSSSSLLDDSKTKEPLLIGETRKLSLAKAGFLLSFLRWLLCSERNLRAAKDEPALLRLLEAMSLASTNTDLKNISGLTAAHVFLHHRRGLYYLQGGHGAFLNELKQLFQQKGDLIDNCCVMKIRPRKEIVLDLRKDDLPQIVKSRKLIVSARWENLNHLLLSQEPFQPLMRHLKSFKASHYPFTLHLGLFESCLPARLAPYVIIINDEKRSVLDPMNCLVMEISRAGDTARAPLGKRSMSVTCYLGKSPWLVGNQELKQSGEKMLSLLEGVLPFLREGIDYLDLDHSIAVTKECQEIVTPRYSAPWEGSYTNLIAPKTSVKNVFLTGGMLMAGLGYEGEARAGIQAANLALKGEDIDFGSR